VTTFTVALNAAMIFSALDLIEAQLVAPGSVNTPTSQPGLFDRTVNRISRPSLRIRRNDDRRVSSSSADGRTSQMIIKEEFADIATASVCDRFARRLGSGSALSRGAARRSLFLHASQSRATTAASGMGRGLRSSSNIGNATTMMIIMSLKSLRATLGNQLAVSTISSSPSTIRSHPTDLALS
jgi:hypothetical protein